MSNETHGLKKHANPWLEREDVGAVTVVRVKLPKVVDPDNIRAVFEPIRALASGTDRNRLVLNLGAVRDLPSMALGQLVLLNRAVQAAKGRLALCRLTPHVQEVLKTTRLELLFTSFPTEEDAVQALLA
jgi:anti-anti-sigma factor